MHLIRRKNVGFVFGYESVCGGVLFFFLWRRNETPGVCCNPISPCKDKCDTCVLIYGVIKRNRNVQFP